MCSSSCCSSRPRSRPGCGCTSATRRCPTKRSRSSPSCCSTRVMGYVQESRAEQAVAALRQMSAAHANVIRDGARQSIPAAELVPGDIILDRRRRHHSRRCAADPVDRAADGRGRADRREPAGVEGHRRRSPARPALGDRHNMIFSGTAATYGRGTRGGHRDRHADRDGAHRRDAEGRARRRPRRCRRSSTASASCWASSSSSSPS